MLILILIIFKEKPLATTLFRAQIFCKTQLSSKIDFQIVNRRITLNFWRMNFYQIILNFQATDLHFNVSIISNLVSSRGLIFLSCFQFLSLSFVSLKAGYPKTCMHKYMCVWFVNFVCLIVIYVMSLQIPLKFRYMIKNSMIFDQFL